MSATGIRIKLEDELRPALLALRRDGLSSGRDAFDVRSHFLTATIGDVVVGSIRLTFGEASVLATWSGGRCPLPTGPRIVELTRGVVARPYRQSHIYKLLMIESMIVAQTRACRAACAAVKPDFVALPFLVRLGFETVCKPVLFHDTPRETIAQPVLCNVPEKHGRWKAMHDRVTGRIRGDGMDVWSALNSITQ